MADALANSTAITAPLLLAASTFHSLWLKPHLSSFADYQGGALASEMQVEVRWVEVEVSGKVMSPDKRKESYGLPSFFLECGGDGLNTSSPRVTMRS